MGNKKWNDLLFSFIHDCGKRSALGTEGKSWESSCRHGTLLPTQPFSSAFKYLPPFGAKILNYLVEKRREYVSLPVGRLDIL